MIDLHQLPYWLVAFGVFVCLPLLGTHSALGRRIAGRWLGRLGSWAAQHLESVPDIDPLTAELYRIRRRERLHADVARLQRILATDEWMSATRQIGNRMAYDWLVAELQRTRHLSPAVFADAATDTWGTAALTLQTTGPSIAHDPQRGSTVEVLDIGWR